MPRRLSFPQLSVSHQPLIYAAAAFILGALVAARFALSLRLYFLITISLWLVAVVGWLRRWNEMPMTLLLLTGCAMNGGLLLAVSRADQAHNSFYQLMTSGELKMAEPVELWGSLNAAPEAAVDRIYLSLQTERIASLQQTHTTSVIINLVVRFADAESRAEYDALQLNYGTRVRVLATLLHSQGYRNPGAIRFDELLEQRGFAASAAVKSPLLIERLPDGKPGLTERFYQQLYGLRARAVSTILRSVQEPASGILLASLFGNRHFLSHHTAEAFRAGGTFHLLVISGAHVAMIALAVLWLTGFIRMAGWLRCTLVIALMWSYALMVGAQPAVTRAVIMLTFALAAQLLYRESSGPNILAASAIALLIWNPEDLFDAGFQLSFLTVLMIVTVAAPLFTRWRNIGRWQPSALTPYPPRVPAWLRSAAEILFWNEAEFQQEMNESLIQYQLQKSPVARHISQSRAGRVLQWSLRTIFATLLTTICVQVGLLPLMVIHFHRFSFSSPLANVIESAAIFLLMIAGLIYLGICAISATLATKLVSIVNLCGTLAVKAADPLARWQSGSLRIPDYPPAAASLIYSVFFLMMLVLLVTLNRWNPLTKLLQKESKARFRLPGLFAIAATVTLLTLFTLIVWHPFRHRYDAGRLSVTFLDVGQGDAIFISFPQGASVLLDSGGQNAVNEIVGNDESDEVFVEDRIGIGEAAVAPFLWQRGIKRLDTIIASHSDSDHTQGFSEIVAGFNIGEAIVGMLPARDEQFDVLRKSLEKYHVPLRVLQRGSSFEIEGARIEILAPFADQSGVPRYGNNQSLIMKLTFGHRTFLFTGDIENQTEGRLIAAQDTLHADVLKVAHHGSRTSTATEFLERVAPRYAVISVAAPSPFGHPHPEIIERLKSSGAETLRTSDCGAITISTDGGDLRLETFVKCR